MSTPAQGTLGCAPLLTINTSSPVVYSHLNQVLKNIGAGMDFRFDDDKEQPDVLLKLLDSEAELK